MSFDIVCQNCGAPSSPAIGVCPYCKSVMAHEDDKKIPALGSIKKSFADGQLERALSLAKILESQKPEILKNKEFVLLYTQILFEVDGPSTKIKSLLNQALIDYPNDPQILEYLEVAEAETNLHHDKNQAGETALFNIIRRSPENVYALFLLGSHLFWIDENPQRALIYLEQCVKLRTNFFRAKACLAAIYKALKMDDLAKRFCNECALKATDPETKKFFNDFADSPVGL